MAYPVGISDFTRLQLELTTFCNAACPSCERAKYEVLPEHIYKKFLNSTEISLDNIKKWLPLDKMTSLRNLHFCGNIDEPTLHSDLFGVCKYFEENTPDHVWIHISTNGGTRNKEFWEEMASLKRTLIVFGIDGLEDTNHIYRKNVRWKKLQDNFRTYIKAGGHAAWQFIKFKHNLHQIEECRKLSLNESFVSFNTVDSTRENFEVEAVETQLKSNSCVRCKATYDNNELEKSFFIDVRGNVWPCCWMAVKNTIEYQFVPIVGHKFGHFLSNNLKYEKFEDIISGEMFSYLYDHQKDFDVCNQHCKENISDVFTWDIEEQWKNKRLAKD